MIKLLPCFVCLIALFVDLHECYPDIPVQYNIRHDANIRPHFYYVPVIHVPPVIHYSAFEAKNNGQEQYNGNHESRFEDPEVDSRVMEYAVIQPDGSIRKFPLVAST